MNNTQDCRIFLCYAKEWLPIIDGLYDELAEAGCRPWMDKRDLTVGQLWEKAIPNAIRTSEFFVACITRQFNGQRRFLQREIKVALDVLRELPSNRVFVLPIRLEPECAVPEELSYAQWDDFFLPGGIHRLVTSIARHSDLPLKIPLPYKTWHHTPVDLNEFSPKLRNAIDSIAKKVSGDLLALCSAYTSDQRGLLRGVLEAAVAAIQIDEGLDIEVTCVDEHGSFAIHPWAKVVGTSLDDQWGLAKTPAFADWLWKNLRASQAGHLTWMDAFASDPLLERKIHTEGWKYERRTVVSFSNVPVFGDRLWTVSVEGHEVVKMRRLPPANREADAAHRDL